FGTGSAVFRRSLRRITPLRQREEHPRIRHRSSRLIADDVLFASEGTLSCQNLFAAFHLDQCPEAVQPRHPNGSRRRTAVHPERTPSTDTKRQILSIWYKSYTWYPVRRAARDPRIAVGMPIAGHPPHGSGRAQFEHPAPTLGV